MQHHAVRIPPAQRERYFNGRLRRNKGGMGNVKTHKLSAVGACIGLLLLLGGGLYTPAVGLTLPKLGCPMAHCDPQMSDRLRLPAPSGEVAQIWLRNELDGEQVGSLIGLGCSGTRFIVACTYAGQSDNLVVYDYEGTRLWTSGDLLNQTAFACTPLIDIDHAVIACDNQRIIKFDRTGSIVWSTDLPEEGIPIGIVPTENGTLVFGSKEGPIYAVDSVDGTLLDTLFVRIDSEDLGFFHTVNFPAVNGNRVYFSMQHLTDLVPDEDHLAWLVAIDVDPTAPEVLTVTWNFVFGGPSGASPLRIGNVIFFDGDRPAPGVGEIDPRIFAVLDLGAQPFELWRKPTIDRMAASFARDPRPGSGLWSYPHFQPVLVRRNPFTGDVDQAINLNTILGEAGGFVPTSVMTITGTRSNPVMLVSATNVLQAAGPTYVIAVDLATSSLRWKYKVSDNPFEGTVGQFQILLGSDGPRVVFTTGLDGAQAIGVPTP